jgi:hypothetical protein
LARKLALTLLRATGMLSRLTMRNRPLPAGPTLPVHGPQMIGPVEARYVVAVGEPDPYALTDDAFVPMLAVRALGRGSRPMAGSVLQVAGAEVSALRRVAGGTVEMRLFNPTSVAATASATEYGDGVAPCGDGARRRASGSVVDLRGRPRGSFGGEIELGPWRFATLRLAR